MCDCVCGWVVAVLAVNVKRPAVKGRTEYE